MNPVAIMPGVSPSRFHDVPRAMIAPVENVVRDLRAVLLVCLFARLELPPPTDDTDECLDCTVARLQYRWRGRAR